MFDMPHTYHKWQIPWGLYGLTLLVRAAVDFDAPDATDKLACLHLDHERPVHVTCARWAAALPRPTRRTHGFGMCVGGYQVGIRLTSDESTGLSRGLGADETAQVGMGGAMCVHERGVGHSAHSWTTASRV